MRATLPHTHPAIQHDAEPQQSNFPHVRRTFSVQAQVGREGGEWREAQHVATHAGHLIYSNKKKKQ